uniref:Uncharacterized protein n=1 Tax=Megaviridae environmental sample TaxID=1737588 RepID=A0A5J6VK36_9VIRU|nr:MAG: hypothetical protein [Megaviridae environmental sample]
MTIENRKIIKYFVPPPIIGTYYKYQDVNKDKKLRKKATNYYLEKILKWINKDKSYKSLKSKKNILNSKEGYDIIYDLLRKYIKLYDVNWYDLFDQKKYLKNYFIYEIGKL